MIVKILNQIYNSFNTATDLAHFLRLIQINLGSIVTTTNMCIALFDKTQKELTFPLYKDTVNRLSTSNFTRNRTSHLAEDIIRNGLPLLLDEEALLRYKPFGTQVFADTIHQKCWLGIPLKVTDTAIGALILQSYTDPDCYTDQEMSFLLSISKQLSIAIDHKQKEEDLRRSEDRYRAIFENSPQGIILFDKEGDIVNCNKHFAAIIGKDPNQIIGSNARDLLPESVHNAVNQALAGLPVLIEDQLTVAENNTTKFLHFTFNPVSPDSQPSNVISMVEDITEKKRMEESARTSQVQRQIFFSALNDAIFVHPLQDEGFAPFIEVNEVASKRYGYSREEFLKLTVKDITDQSYARIHAQKAHRQKLQQEGQLIFEALHIKKSGERFPVEINANVTEQSGRKVILAVARDITERVQTIEEKKNLENRLHQAQKMELVGRLAGGVAHDFNNMLSVILGHTELILDTIDSQSSHYNDITNIHQAANHSAQLTKQLLAFARKQNITPKHIDINEEIRSMLAMLKRLIGEGINLKFYPKKECWPVFFDPSQIDQIITNLCLNARDALKKAGDITIRTQNTFIEGSPPKNFPGIRQGEYTHITVTDNGCGIDDASLPYIFEPFFTTKAAEEGTGLGLATVYGILKQNNGYIYAYSKGSETVFSVFIPRFTGKAESTVQSSIQKKPEKGKETILLVEDEASILNLLNTMLVQHGYNVVLASSPSEALEKSQEYRGKIHLLLTDVVMPEMNGYELAKEIKAENPQAECLYMSGYAPNIFGEQEHLEKKLHFIQKPFTKNHLLTKISSLFKELP